MAKELFSEEPEDFTDDVVSQIVNSIRGLINRMDDGLEESITAASVPESFWVEQINNQVLPSVGAQYLATAARSIGNELTLADRDVPITWPEGVKGAPTVQAMLDAYPQVFAGVTAAQVSYILAQPEWQYSFKSFMQTQKNLVVGMPDSIYKEMQEVLAKQGVSAGFDQLQTVRQFLSWEEEGGYVGWMRRADRIARTELGTARNYAQNDAAVQLSKQGEPVTKMWVAALDERTRPAHYAADGQVREVHEAFNVGGEPLMHPSDRENGSAANTINCRCRAVYRRQELSEAKGRTVKSIADLDRMIEELRDGADALVADGAPEKAFKWEGVLAPLGEPTGDGRVFDDDGEFRFRDFPLPLLWQESTGEGHDSSRIVGSITSGEVKDGRISARGLIFGDETKVLELLSEKVIRPSVDLCDFVGEIEDADTDELLVVRKGTIMAATLVATPAFENVHITVMDGVVDEPDVDGLTASIADVITRYNAGMFHDPELAEPTPITVTDEGRVYGHLALWDTSHVGHAGRSVKPPRSHTGYSMFHQSTVITEDGDRLAVGRLTVGGGHAAGGASPQAAAEHYDQTGSCWAFVRAGEDKHGIWVSGQVNADASGEQIRAGVSAPLSGDWRRIGGGLELVAALSVSTPGFPIRRKFATEAGTMALVAAAGPQPVDSQVEAIDRAVRDAVRDAMAEFTSQPEDESDSDEQLSAEDEADDGLPSTTWADIHKKFTIRDLDDKMMGGEQ